MSVQRNCVDRWKEAPLFRSRIENSRAVIVVVLTDPVTEECRTKQQL